MGKANVKARIQHDRVVHSYDYMLLIIVTSVVSTALRGQCFFQPSQSIHG